MGGMSPMPFMLGNSIDSGVFWRCAQCQVSNDYIDQQKGSTEQKNEMFSKFLVEFSSLLEAIELSSLSD